MSMLSLWNLAGGGERTSSPSETLLNFSQQLPCHTRAAAASAFRLFQRVKSVCVNTHSFELQSVIFFEIWAPEQSVGESWEIRQRWILQDRQNRSYSYNNKQWNQWRRQELYNHVGWNKTGPSRFNYTGTRYELRPWTVLKDRLSLRFQKGGRCRGTKKLAFCRLASRNRQNWLQKE